ncbi:unnamed protein product [Ectocarpus sp. CCAP 1310/34]|nr:unnamed protein product [Ectocarpus sp. CCAP 1310/34]
MREESSTLFPLCTHELALSTRPGAEARQKLTSQENLAYAGIRTPDLTSRRFRGYELDHRGDRCAKRYVGGDLFLCAALFPRAGDREGRVARASGGIHLSVGTGGLNLGGSRLHQIWAMSSEHKSPETEERLGVVRSEGSTGGQVESALGTGGGSFPPSQVVAGAIAAAARAAADGVDSPAGDVASTTQSSADVGVAESSGFPTQSHARALASSGDRQPELGRADDQVQAHVMSRLAHMSVGAAGGGEPSEGTPLASENAKKNTRLEQGQTNIVAQLTEIAGLLKNLRPESGQDGSRGPGGSGGLGLVPASSPWGGGAGGSGGRSPGHRRRTCRV